MNEAYSVQLSKESCEQRVELNVGKTEEIGEQQKDENVYTHH